MSTHRRHWPGLAVAAVALLGACSSSKSSNSSSVAPTTTASSGAAATTAAAVTTAGSTAAGGAGAAVRGVTADSIKVGGIAESTVYVGIEDGVRARFERANREGGVNGRKIDYVGVKDDGSDAGRDLDVTRQLATSDGVFAVAPVVSQVFLPQSSDFLKLNQVPFVGWGFMPGFCGNEFGYGFNGCLIGTDFVNSGLVDPVLEAYSQRSGKAISDVKVALESGDDVTGKSGAAQYLAVVNKRGAKVVYNEQNMPSQTQTTDYSPFAQAVVATQPDIVYASVRFADVIGFSAALRQAGFQGPIVNFVTYVPGLLQAQPQVAQALQGVWVNTQIPPSEGNSTATKMIAADLQAIGKQPFVTLGASVGYWSADVLIQQLMAAGKDLTPASFQTAMKNFTYKPVDGGIGEVAFPKDQNQAAPCAAVVEVKGQAYEQILPMKCYESFPAKG